MVTSTTHLSGRGLLALSVSYLAYGLSAQRLERAPFIYGGGDSFVDLFGPFIVSLALLPLIAAIATARPAWQSLAVAHVGLVGAAALVLVTESAALSLLVLIAIGRQVVAAVLLIVAWRSPRPVTALLAGVFVVPRVLGPWVAFESFDTAFQPSSLVIGLGLALFSAAACVVVRREESEWLPRSKRGLDRTTLVGATLIILGAAVFASRFSIDGFVQSSFTPLLISAVGLYLLGVIHQNRRSTHPAVHLDLNLMAFVAATVILATWIGFGRRVLTLPDVDITAAFDNAVQWDRAVALALIGSIAPMTMLFGRGNRRLMSAGALTLAAAALIWQFFVIGDGELSLLNSLTHRLLINGGALLIVGGLVTFLVRRAEEASIESAVMVVLAGLVLVELVTASVPYRAGGDDLSSDGFIDAGTLGLFTAASAAGLIWLAAWWALRPEHPQPVGIAEQDQDGAEAYAIIGE